MFRFALVVILLVFSTESVAESRVCAVANTTVAKAASGVDAAAQSVGASKIASSSRTVAAAGIGGFLAGAMASIGTVAVGVVAAPIILVSAATTAVAVGGTIAYCQYYDPSANSSASRSATVRNSK